MIKEMAQKIYFILFGASLAIAISGFLFNKEWKLKYATAALSAAWTATVVYLGLRWYWAGRPPLSNQCDSLVFLLWALVTIYLFFLLSSHLELEWLTPWVAALALAGTAGASFLSDEIPPLVPALQSGWLLMHVSAVLAGYAGFTLAFLFAVLFLCLLKPEEKNKRAVLEPLMYRSGLAGSWLLCAGVIAGAVWENSAWGSYWSWDLKQTGALATWLYYVSAIYMRKSRGWTGVRFSWLMVAGFILILFTYFGGNYLLAGLRSYR